MAAGLLVALATAANAAKRSQAHAAMVVDANTGAVLHADAADEPRYPASLTKMMTIYLAFEAIKRGRTKSSAPVRFSQEAASQPPSKLGLDAGDTIPLIDAIKILITKSANDVAVAVAEHLAGTEQRFARAMTNKAREIGMPATTFRNASGLPDSEQVTTARDMVTLGLRLQDDFPDLYKMFSMRYASHDGSRYRNHNNLLFKFQGTEGIKTGYTRASGYNLVASVRRGRRAVVGAVFGGRSASRRDFAMRLLLTRALTKASRTRTRRPQPVLVARATPARRPSSPRVQHPRIDPPAPVAMANGPSRALPPTFRTSLTSLSANQPTPQPQPALRLDKGPARDRDVLAAPGHQAPVGRPPSSLQQQAASMNQAGQPAANPAVTVQLAGIDTAPRYSLRGPSAVQRPSTGGHEIQIGAFASLGEATRALTSAHQAAAEVLAGRPTRTQPVKVSSHRLYRARIGGFDARSAAAACLELRRHSFDCFVTAVR